MSSATLRLLLLLLRLLRLSGILVFGFGHFGLFCLLYFWRLMRLQICSWALLCSEILMSVRKFQIWFSPGRKKSVLRTARNWRGERKNQSEPTNWTWTWKQSEATDSSGRHTFQKTNAIWDFGIRNLEFGEAIWCLEFGVRQIERNVGEKLRRERFEMTGLGSMRREIGKHETWKHGMSTRWVRDKNGIRTGWEWDRQSQMRINRKSRFYVEEHKHEQRVWHFN